MAPSSPSRKRSCGTTSPTVASAPNNCSRRSTGPRRRSSNSSGRSTSTRRRNSGAPRPARHTRTFSTSATSVRSRSAATRRDAAPHGHANGTNSAPSVRECPSQTRLILLPLRRSVTVVRTARRKRECPFAWNGSSVSCAPFLLRGEHEDHGGDGGVLGLIARRLLLLIPVLLIVSFITFSLTALIPGDAATTLAGG